MAQEVELLSKMLSFYKKRYSTNSSTMEEKFNDAVEDLIETGDISKSVYIDFCVTHDIEPRIKKQKPYTPPSTSTYNRSSC